MEVTGESPKTLVELPADALRLIAAALADPVHSRHLCHFAKVCSTLQASLAVPVAALRGEHKAIELLCVQCGTTLGRLLRERPTRLTWSGQGLLDRHGPAICSLVSSGALAWLTHLELGGNRIGDPGIMALAEACARGTLPRLELLYLLSNNIGNAGIEALAQSCASGAMASLQTLYVDDGPLGTDHPALMAACHARGIVLP